MAKTRKNLSSSHAREQFLQNPKMEAAVSELEQLLRQRSTELRCPNEDRGHCLRRWLRAEALDAKVALQRIEAYNAWWESYGMDGCTEADESNENDLLYVCGQDHWSRPTLIARPASHDPKSREDSMSAARRCVYTVHRTMQQMPSCWEEQKAIIIYDCEGLRRQNLDLVFARECVSHLSAMFPERLERVVVINSHWTMAFFWAAIKVLLHKDVVSKISIASTDVEEVLSEFVPQDHPYLRYAVAAQKDKVLRPPRSTFPLQAEEKDTEDLPHNWSRQSTASTTASETSPKATGKDLSVRLPDWPYRADTGDDSDFESLDDGEVRNVEEPKTPVGSWWENWLRCCTTGERQRMKL